MPKSLLDMMRDEDRQKMVARYEARTKAKPNSNKISNEMFLLAEFGLMFGWEAIVSVKHDEITVQEMFALLEAGKKIKAHELIEQGKMTATAVATPLSKQPKVVFERGMKEFIERAK